MGANSSNECSLLCGMCGRDAEELSGSVRDSASQYLDEKRGSFVLPTMEIRECFVQVPMVNLPVNPNHTHGSSASDRSSGSVMIGHIAACAGRTPVFFQGSASDVRNGREISRNYYWVKDVNAPARDFNPSDDDFIAMVDVDYYVDMNKFLRDSFKPIILYTFQPQTLGCSEGEFGFCFDDKGNVSYDVTGGSGYGHPIWHYVGDSVKVTKKFCGITYETSTFALEKRAMGPHHQLVLLAPLAKFTGLAGWVSDKLLSGNELKRLDPRVSGGFTRMLVQTKEGLYMQTGRVGDHTFASVPKHVDDEIASIARVSNTFTISMVKAAVGSVDARGMPLLHEYHLQKRTESGPKMAVVDPYVKTFQYIPHLSALDTDAKPSMVSFMEPIVDGAYCPALCKNNDDRAVTKRVKELQTKPISYTPFLLQVMEEFVEEFARGLGLNRLFPVEIDEVYRRQSKPTQQRILERAEYEMGTDKTSTFVKREAYMNPNDPRIISQINGVDKREYSQFMYALSDYLKTIPWCASGRSNAEIAERIAQICSTASFIGITDFARMDGRVSALARHLDKLLMTRVFHPRFHADMLRLMKKQHNLNGHTKFGIKYKTGDTRCSGSPETSPFNVNLNAFVGFLALRMERHPPDAAWNKLGLYMGDDGVTADVPKKTYERAAAAVGQLLTSEIIVRGEKGVNFLSRRYGPDVWYGDMNSMCAPARALSKFHVTVHMPSNITPVAKLVDKSFAAWLNDASTPILGDFVSVVVRISGMRIDKFKNLNNAWNVSSVGTYPNKRADWMLDAIREELPNFDIDRFIAWTESIKTLQECLKPLDCNVQVEPKPKSGLLELQGDIVGTQGPDTTEPTSDKGSEGWQKVMSKKNKKIQRKAKDAVLNPTAPRKRFRVKNQNTTGGVKK